MGSSDTPPWLEWALSRPGEEHTCEYDGTTIHYLRWRSPAPASLQGRGRRGIGVVLVHGSWAHAHWWDHVAPYLAAGDTGLALDVVALSSSGHGQSGWRDSYTCDTWAFEVVAVARDAGLFDTDRDAPPVVVGHSIGSFVAERAIQLAHPKAFSGLIVVDGGIPHPLVWSQYPTPALSDMDTQFSKPFGVKTYATDVDPASRLRLAPPQRVRYQCVLDHVAKHSVRAVEGGWAWAFDPERHKKTESFLRTARLIGTPGLVRSLGVRIGVLCGADSAIVDPLTRDYMRHELGDAVPVVAIPDAEHHLFLDQPLAFVTAVVTMLSEWSRSAVVSPTTIEARRACERADPFAPGGEPPAVLAAVGEEPLAPLPRLRPRASETNLQGGPADLARKMRADVPQLSFFRTEQTAKL